MSTAKKVAAIVRQAPVGRIITYDSFAGLQATERQATAQTLCRLVRAGVLKKIGRGKFYKPAQGRFGALPLSEQEQLRSALEQGYISGAEAFNRLGITTQFSREVVIAAPGKAYSTRIGDLNVRYVRARTEVRPENVEMLMILDALQQVNNVQDASPDRVVAIVQLRIKKMDMEQARQLATLGKAYPPRVRALLGAILEVSGRKRLSAILKNTLNPLSKYKLGIREALPNRKAWNLQ